MRSGPGNVLNLSATIIRDREPAMPIIPGIHAGGGYNFVMGNSFGMPVFSSHQMSNLLGRLNAAIAYADAHVPTVKKTLEDNYNNASQTVSQSIEDQLVETRRQFGSESLAPVEAVRRELKVRDVLLAQKVAEFQADSLIANSFFGGDPLSRTESDIAFRLYEELRKRKTSFDASLNAWEQSYQAAYSAKLNIAHINMLNVQYASVVSFLNALQQKEQAEANEQSKIWAEIRTWADKLNARRDPIVTQYHQDLANLVSNVQSDLDVENALLGPLTNQTPESWVARALALVAMLQDRRLAKLKEYRAALSKFPNIDFTKSELKGFLERARDGGLNADDSFEREVNLISMAFREDVLLHELRDLSARLPTLRTAEASIALADAESRASLNEPPTSPPGVSLDANLEFAKGQKDFYGVTGIGFIYHWFYLKVKNRGDWDYKQRGRQYEEFGNFNYGATGAAAGIPDAVLLRAAGAAQILAGTSSGDFSECWLGSPYGDDPVDQVWIQAGIDYAKSKIL